MSKTKTKTVDCPKCSGAGFVAFGTDEISCDLCDGKGKVTAQKAAAWSRSQ